MADYFPYNGCFINGDRPKRLVICNYIPTSNKGSITFDIGDYSYSIPLRDIWICSEELCRFTIKENSFGDEFVFGAVFYQFFNMLFDYEDSKIHFYSYKGIKRIDYNSNHIGSKTQEIKYYKLIKGIIIGLIFNLLIGLCMLIK